ncbi:hypothetical protein [Candidatus Amarolinea aalborgensis]|jgi:hypothetical protein|uniref:hypothetical protein n=1 Tax=Candidatus Amarolinea aalborgensis TaxID=2249329 RepID=UPI003BF9EC14
MMTTFMDVLLVLGMFLLRIGVPLLITLALGYALSRLDARWQAEADAARRAEQAALRRQPAPGLIWPRPTMAASALTTDIAGAPCWSVKGCGETQRQACPAFRQPTLPCWMARWRTEGAIPSGCPDCTLYLPFAPSMPTGDRPAVVH